MMPTVSVILPTYNRVHFVKRAIESVLAQTFPDWELIVVDDGSTDETPQVLESYLTDRRIRFLRKGHEGLARTRNAGMGLAKGKYVAFLDDDDLFLPHKLEKQVAWMEQHPETGLLYSAVKIVDGGMENPRLHPRRFGRSFLELFQENFIQVATVLIRRECFNVIGDFNEALGGSEDYEMWLRIAQRFRIAYLPEALAVYCKHDANLSRDLVKQRRSELEILRRFPVDPAKGLTPRVSAQRFAITHYKLARTYRGRKNYLKAAAHFFSAIRLKPTVGLDVKNPPPKGWDRMIQLVKPYGGVLYCLVRGLFDSRGGNP